MVSDDIERAEVYFGNEVEPENSLELNPDRIEVMEDNNGDTGLLLVVPQSSLPKFREIREGKQGSVGGLFFLVERLVDGSCKLVKVNITKCVDPEIGWDVLAMISDRDEIEFNPDHIRAKYSGDDDPLTLSVLWDLYLFHDFYDEKVS